METPSPSAFPAPARGPDGRWRLEPVHAWQRRLRARVERRDRFGPIRLVAGVDVSYARRDPTLHAAVVVLDAETLDTAEVATFSGEATFPYIPGLLSFREAPPILAAFARLRARPDLVLVDGHGEAHPRRFGIACHLGIALDLPTIGVGKSVLVGVPGALARERGATAPLTDGEGVVGTVLRTRRGVAPVFVSIGHRVSLDSAARLVLASCTRYRLPEPARRAHAEANRLRAGGVTGRSSRRPAPE